MFSSFQGTLVSPILLTGKGLHTSGNHSINLLPAKDNTGVVFRRIDKKGSGINISASWKNTKPLPLCTCLVADNGLHVRTIEHLMSAFYACGIDNVLIEVNGSEIPVFDGSAEPFVNAIDSVGVDVQDAPRNIFKVTQSSLVKDGKRYIKVEPYDSLYVDMTISLSKIGKLNWAGEVTPELFKSEIARARTFGNVKNGLLAQLTRFNKDPICLGANTKSAVVIHGDKVFNKGGLRMRDEFIKHRVLDLVGDLMLTGGHVQGKITASRTAHRLNHLLLREIFENNKFEKLP